jgi:predicted enzyme related to lactoylglutathione lyase
MPPMWNSYVTVLSADTAAQKAGELGAIVHAPPFDVMDAGRMAAIEDPQGAHFNVWEPKNNIGAGLVNAHGALSWNELATPDIDASSRFYSELFGWTVEAFEGMGMPYSTIKTAAGSGNGGMRPAMPPGSPPFWLVYFGTNDIDASLAKSAELGGKTLVEKMDIGVGQLAVAQDPQGAVFALFAGELDD